MPDLMDRIYCSEQIHIPPTFPYIMKLYCKAAIRTQPYDLLKWSAAYFRALANGEEPPAKERVEYPPYDSPSGLTPGYIKILINQFGKDPETKITAQTLFKKWNDICLDEYLLIKLIALLGANTTVSWVQFVGVCAGFISKTLTQTMILICELFTEEPEGGMASVPFELFADLYMFLAQMECGPISESEKAELDAIINEEEVCDVADKIRQGKYEGETEGEGVFRGETDVGEEEGGEIELKPEDESTLEDEASVKDSDLFSSIKEESKEKGLGKDSSKEAAESLGEVSQTDERSEDEPVLEKSIKDSDSQISEYSGDVEAVRPETSSKDVQKMESKISEKADEVEEKEEKKEESKPEDKPKKIALEDLQDSIRAQIEEKLGEEEEESVVDEEDKEFEELGSYLLGAAARVQKFTAETLGFKIFRRFMRQEVPGIGPVVETEQVEKVIDFMDSWAQKQERMVMPRNIRHWMCPPLDKVPTPQP